MSDKDFSDWSNARRQIYAAKCLEAFTRHFGVEDVSVEMLLAHLKKIGELDFGKWERAGAILPLNGRGDAKPSGLEEKIPSNIRSVLPRSDVEQVSICVLPNTPNQYWH